jgi:hypothetical protein
MAGIRKYMRIPQGKEILLFRLLSMADHALTWSANSMVPHFRSHEHTFVLLTNGNNIALIGNNSNK